MQGSLWKNTQKPHRASEHCISPEKGNLWSGCLSLILFVRNLKQEPCVLLLFQKAKWHRPKGQGVRKKKKLELPSWLPQHMAHISSCEHYLRIAFDTGEKGEKIVQTQRETHHNPGSIRYRCTSLRSEPYRGAGQRCSGKWVGRPWSHCLKFWNQGRKCAELARAMWPLFLDCPTGYVRNTNALHRGLDFSYATYSSASSTHNLVLV